MKILVKQGGPNNLATTRDCMMDGYKVSNFLVASFGKFMNTMEIGLFFWKICWMALSCPLYYGDLWCRMYVVLIHGSYANCLLRLSCYKHICASIDYLHDNKNTHTHTKTETLKLCFELSKCYLCELCILCSGNAGHLEYALPRLYSISLFSSLSHVNRHRV